MAGSLTVLDIDDPLWSKTAALADADIFYQPDYCRFRSAGWQDRPLMFRYEDNLGLVFDVSLARSVARLPFYSDVADEFGDPPVDLASPEYNGPIVVCAPDDRAELLRRYRASVSGQCKTLGVVTEFVRLHPDSACVEELNAIEPLTVVSDIVYIDLTAGYEAVHRNYRSDRRRRIKQAKAGGGHAQIVEPTPERIGLFAELYAINMARYYAKRTSFHDAAFFVSLFQHIGNGALLIESLTGAGNLASMHIFLRGQRHLWAVYLASVDSERSNFVNCLVYDLVSRWGSGAGYRSLFLGGGITRGDDLFKYKLGYSPHVAAGRHMRKVHNPEVLGRLTTAKAAFDARHGKPTRTDYFPSYWLE